MNDDEKNIHSMGMIEIGVLRENFQVFYIKIIEEKEGLHFDNDLILS